MIYPNKLYSIYLPNMLQYIQTVSHIDAYIFAIKCRRKTVTLARFDCIYDNSLIRPISLECKFCKFCRLLVESGRVFEKHSDWNLSCKFQWVMEVVLELKTSTPIVCSMAGKYGKNIIYSLLA